MASLAEFYDLQILYNHIAVLLSVLFNGFLIYLILTRSPKQLAVYKYFMVFVAVFEIGFSMLEVVLVPIHYSFRSAVAIIVCHTDKPFSRPTLTFLNSIYWFFFGACLTLFAVHFIYRFLVVSGSKLLKTFHSWKVVVWFSMPFLIGVVWAATGFFLCRSNEKFVNFIREDFDVTVGRDIDDFDLLGLVMYYENEQGQLKLVIESALAMGIMSVSVAVSCAIILIFGLKCYFHIANLMRRVSTSSSRSQTLQKQLFQALVIQTLIPLLLLHIPISVVFGLAVFNAGFGFYGAVISVLITIYPTIDPLPNFVIISPYRRAICECFFKPLPQVNRSEASSIVVPTQFNLTRLNIN